MIVFRILKAMSHFEPIVRILQQAVETSQPCDAKLMMSLSLLEHILVFDAYNRFLKKTLPAPPYEKKTSLFLDPMSSMPSERHCARCCIRCSICASRNCARPFWSIGLRPPADCTSCFLYIMGFLIDVTFWNAKKIFFIDKIPLYFVEYNEKVRRFNAPQLSIRLPSDERTHHAFSWKERN